MSQAQTASPPRSPVLMEQLEAAIKTHYPNHDRDWQAFLNAKDAYYQFKDTHPIPRAEGRGMMDGFSAYDEWKKLHKDSLEPLESAIAQAREHYVTQKSLAKKALFATPRGRAQFYEYFNAELADISLRKAESSVQKHLKHFKGDFPAFLSSFANDTHLFQKAASESNTHYYKYDRKYLPGALGLQARELAELEGKPMAETMAERLRTIEASPQSIKFFSRIAHHQEMGTLTRFEGTAWRLFGKGIEERNKAWFSEANLDRIAETTSELARDGAGDLATGRQPVETTFAQRLKDMHWGSKTAIIGGTVALGGALGYWAFKSKHDRATSPQQGQQHS